MSVKTNVEEMLVEKGIITRAQLERVKKVQFDHRDKSHDKRTNDHLASILLSVIF